jgi:hypothetical protein
MLHDVATGPSASPRHRYSPRATQCSIEETGLEGDYGTVDGIQATCLQCGHVTESFGTSDASTRRCLALMREGCPRGNAGYYVEARR